MVKCPALNSTPKPTTATTHQELSGRKVGRHHGAVAVTVAAASVPSSQAACITRAPVRCSAGSRLAALTARVDSLCVPAMTPMMPKYIAQKTRNSA